jgi:hypothetical protein
MHSSEAFLCIRKISTPFSSAVILEETICNAPGVMIPDERELVRRGEAKNMNDSVRVTLYNPFITMYRFP